MEHFILDPSMKICRENPNLIRISDTSHELLTLFMLPATCNREESVSFER